MKDRPVRPRPPTSVLAFLSGLGALSVMAGCASAPVRSAERGDLRDLAVQIQKRIDDRSLTSHQAGEIAKAVAEREISEASGKEGVTRIRELHACARDLEDALSARERRSRGASPDDVAIEAAWARALYSGEDDASDARDYATSPNPRLRAIAPLGYVRDKDAALRRKAMTDPEREARRGAIRAAEKARDVGDVPSLAEAARLDPDPLVRSEAVRALAEIGGPEVSARLRDLWTAGDDGVRGDVAVAWTRPQVFRFGGDEALRVMMAREHGAGAIEAASAVLRSPRRKHDGVPQADDDDASLPSGELRAMAVALLAQSIEKESRRSRLHALATAPLGGPAWWSRSQRERTASERDLVLASVRRASLDDDVEIKIAALARLLELDSDRPRAIAELEPVAGREQGRLSQKALFSLASAGHLRIQAWLERDLRSPQADARLSALLGLIALERGPRGATLLADADASVRTRASCLLLAASHRRH